MIEKNSDFSILSLFGPYISNFSLKMPKKGRNEKGEENGEKREENGEESEERRGSRIPLSAATFPYHIDNDHGS